MKTLRSIFLEDQDERKKKFGPRGMRQPTRAEFTRLAKRDKIRRSEVLRRSKKGLLKRKTDLYYAAMILQHGNRPTHYQLANLFARKSMEMGYEPAKWLYAATMDRYLSSLGKQQKFGTQFYKRRQNESWMLRPYNKQTTDKEREKYNVSSLKKAKEYLKELNKNSN